jgi:hypothetical protein
VIDGPAAGAAAAVGQQPRSVTACVGRGPRGHLERALDVARAARPAGPGSASTRTPGAAAFHQRGRWTARGPRSPGAHRRRGAPAGAVAGAHHGLGIAGGSSPSSSAPSAAARWSEIAGRSGFAAAIGRISCAASARERWISGAGRACRAAVVRVAS